MKEELLKIINHYRVENQQRKLNEEVFELQEAIIRKEYLPNEKDVDPELFAMNLEIEKAKEHIEEELADVMVLLTQIKYYYELDNERIKEIMKQKVNRQLDRMKQGE